MRWLLLAWVLAVVPAAAHDAAADVRLARMLRYSHGPENGVAPDPAGAARLFERAALAGDADAAFTLANMLRDGEGMARDAAAARRWLERAAEGGSPEALQQLAMEEPDPARAAQLLREAAHALTHSVR